MPPTETLPDTPVMRQFQELKSRHPEALLFFRLGDFYELFGSDAQTAAPLLGLVLTARQGVAMCGVPFHSSKTYLAKLLKAGHKVAVAEQMEDPSKTKKLVKRAIIRLITPGTIIEDELLEATATNFLVAVESDIVGWGAACIDVSTGEFWATQTLNDRGDRRLFDLLARLRPAEVLCAPEAAAQLRPALPATTCVTLETDQPESAPPPAWTRDSVWVNHRLALRAALRCRGYVARTQFHLQELIAPVYRESANEMQLDETALRTLELVDSSSGDRRHSLWGLLNRCRTAMGSRKLRHWVLHPSTDLAEIELRQNCVEDLFDKPGARETLGELLREVSDLPRVVSRLSTRQATPRDLAALRRSLGQLPALERWFQAYELCPGLTTLALQLQETAQGLRTCADYLDRALVDDPPARLSDGRFIREGFHAELDELRLLRSDSQTFLSRLEAEERQASGIGSLKAGYNSVFGYYFEITNAHKAKVPARYTRKQTLTNAERYITPELKELENKILGAEEKILRLEARLFEEVRGEVLTRHDAVQRLGALLAELDVFNALAEIAALHEFVKPQVDLSYDLDIVEGRHPVLAAVLPAGTFVPQFPDPERPRPAGHRPDRPQHVGKIHLPAPERAHRGSGPDGILRACQVRPGRHRGQDPHPHRRPGRPDPGRLHLHGGDDRDLAYPQVGHPAQPGHPRRSRPRHLHLRWHLHRLGGAGAPAGRLRQARGAGGPARPAHALRHALLRAHRTGPPPGGRRQRQRGSPGVDQRGRPHRSGVPAQDLGRASRPLLWYSRGGLGRVTARGPGPRQRDSLQPGERVRLRPVGQLPGPAHGRRPRTAPLRRQPGPARPAPPGPRVHDAARGPRNPRSPEEETLGGQVLTFDLPKTS